VVQNVRAMAPFRGTLGQFDRPTFIQAVQAAGYSEQQFLDEVRQDMTRDQLTQAVKQLPGAATYCPGDLPVHQQKRAADYVILSPEQAGDVPAPSDAVLSAYVKLHAERFSTAEYRDARLCRHRPRRRDRRHHRQRRADPSRITMPTRPPMSSPKSAMCKQIEFKTLADAAAARAKIGSGHKL